MSLKSWAVPILLLLAALTGSPPVARADQPLPRPLAIEDLYHFDRPEATSLSPDGKQLVYERRWIDRATRRQRHALWLVEEGQPPRPLEKDEPDGRAPVFSPDGHWIAFLSTRPCKQGAAPIPATPPYSCAKGVQEGSFLYSRSRIEE